MAVVVTVCSNRKRLPPRAGMRARDLPSGAPAEVAAEWFDRIEAAEGRIEAIRLYCGRSFLEALSAAKAAGGALYIVSAGLGVISGHDHVPSYSLSVVGGSKDNVLRRLDGVRSPMMWWQALAARQNSRAALHIVVTQSVDRPILVALPCAYLAMIQNDLLALPEVTRERLRIFLGSRLQVIDECLWPFVMPYDNRLDGAESPIRGTQSDFTQRAVRHFVEAILNQYPNGSIERHRGAVQAALANWGSPVPHNRSRLTDNEILELIRMHWGTVAGQSGRMLRFLRDELGVACEQGRLGQLFRAVRAERGLLQ